MRYNERIDKMRKKMVELRKNDKIGFFVATDGYYDNVFIGHSSVGSDSMMHFIAIWFRTDMTYENYDYWFTKAENFMESLEIGEIEVFGMRGNRPFLVGRV